MIRRITCYSITCTVCRTSYEEDDREVHFESADDAISAVTQHAGWTLTEAGNPVCHRCTADIRCARDGHDYSPWYPCACHGRIPDHALFGCGMFRFCHDCDHHETATLATLPTIEEPHAFGS